MKYLCTSGTDVGLVRQNNEDSFLVDDDLTLFVVADGMGGYQKGEVASKITCESICNHIREAHKKSPKISKNSFMEAVQKANLDIRAKIEATPNLDRMGSTVVSMLIRQDCLLFANVGDSRAYRYRNNELVQITVDHSLVQETKAAGIKRELAPQFKNIVTRAMGMKDQVVADIYAEHCEAEDIYLLCSDGLHGFVTDEKIASILAFGTDLEAHVAALIQAAKDGTGKDNITCVVVKIIEPPEEEGKPLTDTFQIPLYQREPGGGSLMTSLQWRLLFMIILLVVLLAGFYAGLY
jgi:serine/threonine protein phosphatase PrpC